MGLPWQVMMPDAAAHGQTRSRLAAAPEHGHWRTIAVQVHDPRSTPALLSLVRESNGLLMIRRLRRHP
ncbi:hypothetical protein VTN02DRAFT_6552 [Thermoascus thermophilus]